MFVKTTNRWDAIRAFVNEWLKDPSLYCNNCMMPYKENPVGPCCDDPFIVNNHLACELVAKQNAEIKKTRNNEFGSNKNHSLRWGASIPPKLIFDVERYLKKCAIEQGYDPVQEGKLFRTKYFKKDLRRFLKTFPAFSIPEKV